MDASSQHGRLRCLLLQPQPPLLQPPPLLMLPLLQPLLPSPPTCRHRCQPARAGLDARAASIVMRAVRNVARNGRTVMVTIHQPSIEIFEAFDTLLLLQVRVAQRATLRSPRSRRPATRLPGHQAAAGRCPAAGATP